MYVRDLKVAHWLSSRCVYFRLSQFCSKSCDLAIGKGFVNLFSQNGYELFVCVVFFVADF